MRKSILILFISLTALSMSSCLKNKSDINADYNTVYPGYLLYASASYANDISLDPLSVAMRLGLLLNEIDIINADAPDTIVIGGEDDTQPDWDKLGNYSVDTEFDNDDDLEDEVEISRMELLFGDSNEVKIWRNGDIYYIRFGKTSNEVHVQAALDNMYRRGTYIIDTKGVKLEEATSSNAWSVTAFEGSMSISTGYDSEADYRLDFKDSFQIYYDVINPEASSTKKGFIYSVNEISPNTASTSSTSSDTSKWEISGYVRIDDFSDSSDSFIIDDTFTKRFGTYIKSYGTPLGAPALSFETTTPYDVRPLTAGFKKYNAKIEISLDAVDTYYTGKDVYLELDNYGTLTIEYNGTTYEN